MSIHSYELKDGTSTFQVKYRVRKPDGSTVWETESFGRKYDGDAKTRAQRDRRRRAAAEQFQQKVTTRAESGGLDRITGGKITLAVFMVTWLKIIAAKHSEKTRTNDAYLWDAHVDRQLGDYQLRELSEHPEIIDKWISAMEIAGVGKESRRKVITMLGSVLRLARRYRYVDYNPVEDIDRPSPKRERAVRPWSIAQVEGLRSWIIDDARVPDFSIPRNRFVYQGWRDTRVEDAGLLSVLAYAGLRPEEALALRVSSIGRKKLLIDGAIVDGELEQTKNKGRHRSVDLVGPLADDLRAVMRAAGAKRPHDFVFRNPDGSAWSDGRYRDWRKRVFQLAAIAEGLGIRVRTEKGHAWRSPDGKSAGPRPYDGRHTFLSGRLHEGLAPAAVALQGGQSVAVLLDTYTHVVEDLDAAEREALDLRIRRHRGQDVSKVAVLKERDA